MVGSSLFIYNYLLLLKKSIEP